MLTHNSVFQQCFKNYPEGEIWLGARILLLKLIKGLEVFKTKLLLSFCRNIFIRRILKKLVYKLHYCNYVYVYRKLKEYHFFSYLCPVPKWLLIWRAVGRRSAIIANYYTIYLPIYIYCYYFLILNIRFIYIYTANTDTLYQNSIIYFNI